MESLFGSSKPAAVIPPAPPPPTTSDAAERTIALDARSRRKGAAVTRLSGSDSSAAPASRVGVYKALGGRTA